MKETRRICKRHNTASRYANRIALVFSIFFVFILVPGFVQDHSYAQDDNMNLQPKVQITDGDEWHYFKGFHKPSQDWYRYDFDMSNWQSGPTGIGYGIGSNRTYLADMRGNYLALYARKEFTLNDRNPVKSMKLSVVCDGPFVAYLNGVEIIRTGTIQMSKPLISTGMPPVEAYDVSGFIHELIPDKNILAVKCDNDDITSEDFSFIPVLQIYENGEGQ